MRVRLDGDDFCSYVVSSQSDGGVEYVVDLCAYPIGKDEDGNMQFNGSCTMTRKENEWLEHGCADFIYRCEPKLKRLGPDEQKFFRCKHCRAAAEYAFKLILPHLAKNRKNVDQSELP